HILVDEYQDTNLLQCEIVDRLATTHRNLMVVGDDAQSIYGFRGANPDNMLQFAKRWPEAQLHKLEINYRSTPEILALANQSIQNNLFQLPKQLEAVRPSGQLPALVSVRDADVQAAFIAQRVLELVDEGIALKDMAVLYRAHHHSLELQVELTSREIPYMVRSGVRFFEQAHIKDILAYLRIIENPRDEISWLRILKMQPGIGRSGALKTIRQLMEATEPLDYATGIDPGQLPARSRAGLAQLQTQLKRILSDDIRTNPSRVILALLENGYRELLPTLYPNPQSRLDDIEQLAQYSEHFDSPVSFLSELNLLSEFGSETLVDTKHADDMLTLSTIHQAKGLEWKVVFVIGLNEGLFPHPRAINEEGGLEEERRLFYVSTTRTRDELYLVSPLVADRHGRRRVVMKPSRFIPEIDKPELIERWSVENEPRQTGH
ncbi:MAG: UvrD-helicase domain-containing protein, partial [Deltaproteobacteria bacterium]|nr:UvrD-helicase domain-containing protein [Deltaproteobacteria bacterium]